MNYTILKQWKTLDGGYYSATTNYGNYDSAIGNYHSMFKPMQNDTNVYMFRFSLIDENGVKVEACSWTRQIPDTDTETE